MGGKIVVEFRSMWQSKRLAILIVSSLLVVACGNEDDNNSGGNSTKLATTICEKQIACEYQLATQADCVDLFVSFMSESQLSTCEACVSAEPCATQMDTCMDACSVK
jgi:hypothetical protein